MNSRRLRFPHLRAVLIAVGIYVLIAILARILTLLPLDSGGLGVSADPPVPAGGADVVSTSAVPDLMGSFSPDGYVPGTWVDAGKTVEVPDPGSGCSAIGRKWSGTDGANLYLIWSPCTNAGLTAEAKADAGARLAQRWFGPQWRAQSVLPNHADVVMTLESGGVVRQWIQGAYRVMVVTVCPGGQGVQCAALSADAVRYLSSRMPGTPRVDPLPVSSFFPPLNK